MRGWRALQVLWITLAIAVGMAAAKERVTMWSTGDQYKDSIMAIMPDFQKAFPDVELEITFYKWAGEPLVVALLGNAGPDIATIPSREATQYIHNNLVQPVDYGVFGVRNAAELQNQFLPGSQRLMFFHGEAYTVPTELVTFVLMTNNHLLNEAGFSAQIKTWDDATSASRKVAVQNADGSYQREGFMLERGDQWVTWMWTTLMRQSGLSWAMGEIPTFATPLVDKVLQTYVGFFSEGRVSRNADWRRFDQGKAAFRVGMLSGVVVPPAERTFELGTYPFPVLRGGTPATPAYSWGMYVTKEAKNRHLAWQVIHFFTQPKYQHVWLQNGLFIPVRGSATDELAKHPQFQLYAQSIVTSYWDLMHVKYLDIRRRIDAAEKRAIDDGMNLYQSLLQLDTELNAFR